jgi:predicted DCC family thiol-disulfide oxidoreductase YuxK
MASSLPPSASPSHPTILYDGVCNLCAGVVKFVIARDPGPDPVFRFASLQSSVGRALLADHGIADADALKSFVVIDGGVAYRKSSAALRVAQYLPAPWGWAGPAGACVPAFLRDAVYDCVARNRYAVFGKSEEDEDGACLLPTADVRRRFLDWGSKGGGKKGGAGAGGAGGVGATGSGDSSRLATGERMEGGDGGGPGATASRGKHE